jgi:ABC-type glycerol-3-phosphate transport system permease component
MRSTGAGRWLVAAPMALLAIATIYPMLYTLNIALKSRVDYVLDRGALTTTFNFQNFVDAWNQANMGRYYLNSILVTVVSVALILLIASMAGFALSHLTFRGSRATFLLILAAMMIPFQVIMVPFIKTLSDFGMINTYPGLIAAYVSQFLLSRVLRRHSTTEGTLTVAVPLMSPTAAVMVVPDPKPCAVARPEPSTATTSSSLDDQSAESS